MNRNFLFGLFFSIFSFYSLLSFADFPVKELLIANSIGEIKPIILTATYAVVVFSILIQGLTIESLIKRFHNE